MEIGEKMNKKITKRVVLALACLIFALMPVASAMAQSKVNISLSASYDENEHTLGLALENAKGELAAAEENERQVRSENGNANYAEEIRAELKRLKEAKAYVIKYFLEDRSNQYESALTIEKLIKFLDTEPALVALNLTEADKAKVKALVEEALSFENINRSIELIKTANDLRTNPDLRPYNSASAVNPQLPGIPNGELKVSADLMMFSAVSNALFTVMYEKNGRINHDYFMALISSKYAFMSEIFNSGSGENLALMYSDPFNFWFDYERQKYVNGTYGSEYEIAHYKSLMNGTHKITGLTVNNLRKGSPSSEQCFGRDDANKSYLALERFKEEIRKRENEIDQEIAKKEAELRNAENSDNNAAIKEAVQKTNAAREKLKQAQAAYDANKQIRLAGSDRYETAYAVAEQMKLNKGKEKFDNIVVASGENYPDALSGNYLAFRKNAPMLLTNKYEVDNTAEYIKNSIEPNGTVYILGQTSAVPASLEQKLQGINIKRIGGSDRFETNLLILKEARVHGEELIVCSGLNFPDAVSASAANKPILLADDKLSASQKNYLSTIDPLKVYFIGGDKAVPKTVRDEFTGDTVRLAGSDRFETSRLIAENLFLSHPDRVILASGLNFPDALVGGAFNQDIGVPVLLVGPDFADAYNAKKFVSENGTKSLILLGGKLSISDEIANYIRG